MDRPRFPGLAPRSVACTRTAIRLTLELTGIEAVKALADSDIRAVDELIRQSLQSDVRRGAQGS